MADRLVHVDRVRRTRRRLRDALSPGGAARVFTNRALVGAVALTVMLQILLLVVPFARDTFGLEPLAAAHWSLVIGIAIAYLTIIELDKALHHRRAVS